MLAALGASDPALTGGARAPGHQRCRRDCVILPAMLRPLVLFLTLCTGFTGLAYEITWQKYLAMLLGAHSEATASVLGLFLGGLSLGYWVFGALTRRLVERGRRTGRPAPLLLVYGAIEAGIGAYCLLFPSIFPLVRSASVWLPTGAGALAFAVDLGSRRC